MQDTTAEPGSSSAIDRFHSIAARVISVLGLAGLVASIALIIAGRFDFAYGIAMVIWVMTMLYWSILDYRAQDRMNLKRRTLREKSMSSGSFFSLMLVFITVYVLTWPLGHDDALILSAPFVRTILPILLASMFTVSFAHEAWHRDEVRR